MGHLVFSQSRFRCPDGRERQFLSTYSFPMEKNKSPSSLYQQLSSFSVCHLQILIQVTHLVLSLSHRTPHLDMNPDGISLNSFMDDHYAAHIWLIRPREQMLWLSWHLTGKGQYNSKQEPGTVLIIKSNYYFHYHQ